MKDVQKSSTRLLVVEDERELLRELGKSLRNVFDTVYTATDGLVALELCKEYKIDIIITDLNMPNMCGNDLIEELAKKGSSTPVIILSGYLDALKEYNNIENITVLAKPYSIDELVEKVRYYENGTHKLDPYDRLLNACKKAKKVIDEVKRIEVC